MLLEFCLWPKTCYSNFVKFCFGSGSKLKYCGIRIGFETFRFRHTVTLNYFHLKGIRIQFKLSFFVCILQHMRSGSAVICIWILEGLGSECTLRGKLHHKIFVSQKNCQSFLSLFFQHPSPTSYYLGVFTSCQTTDWLSGNVIDSLLIAKGRSPRLLFM